jgi:hypothetical protein
MATVLAESNLTVETIFLTITSSAMSTSQGAFFVSETITRNVGKNDLTPSPKTCRAYRLQNF